VDALILKVAARYKGKKTTEKGNVVYMYSERQIARRNADKAKRLEGLRSNIAKVRAQVAKDLKSGDPDKALTALAIALIDETYERVGNDESADDGHFGVTGWQKDHVSFGKGKATISYVGKAGVKQKKTVKSQALVKALRDAYEGCEGDDLFCHATGRVTATKVNAYLKRFGVTAKDLRGFHANREMQERLRAARKGALPEDPKERVKKLKDEFKKALEETASAVGHEPSTLKSQYLVPGLEDQYLKDGTVSDKMVKSASLGLWQDPVALRVATRFAAIKRLDLAWVESLRKDFLTILKNLPRVKDYETAHELRTVVRRYRENFNTLFFEHFLNNDLKYNLGLSEGDAKWMDKTLRSVAWDFSSDLSNLPIGFKDDYWSEEALFARFEREFPQWKARVQRKAQAFWKAVKTFITWYESNQKSTVDVEVPDEERVVLEGFQLIMQGFKPGNEYNEQELEVLKEGLRVYRRRASAVAPILLQKQVPVFVEFKAALDKGGEYDVGTQTITFWASSIINKGPPWVAHVMAHEMGHHLWRTFLGSDAQEFWVQTIKGDFGDLDVEELVRNWPGNAWAYEMTRYLGDTDPILALQVEALAQDRSTDHLSTKEDFEALLARGTKKLRTPKTPITGYANKNPEEAFCEAIGLLVAHGPRALHERVRWWLDTALAGAVKVAARRKPFVMPEPPS
jgi:hypothetical protein